MSLFRDVEKHWGCVVGGLGVVMVEDWFGLGCGKLLLH